MLSRRLGVLYHWQSDFDLFYWGKLQSSLKIFYRATAYGTWALQKFSFKEQIATGRRKYFRALSLLHKRHDVLLYNTLRTNYCSIALSL